MTSNTRLVQALAVIPLLVLGANIVGASGECANAILDVQKTTIEVFPVEYGESLVGIAATFANAGAQGNKDELLVTAVEQRATGPSTTAVAQDCFLAANGCDWVCEGELPGQIFKAQDGGSTIDYAFGVFATKCFGSQCYSIKGLDVKVRVTKEVDGTLGTVNVSNDEATADVTARTVAAWVSDPNARLGDKLTAEVRPEQSGLIMDPRSTSVSVQYFASDGEKSDMIQLVSNGDSVNPIFGGEVDATADLRGITFSANVVGPSNANGTPDMRPPYDGRFSYTVAVVPTDARRAAVNSGAGTPDRVEGTLLFRVDAARPGGSQPPNAPPDAGATLLQAADTLPGAANSSSSPSPMGSASSAATPAYSTPQALQDDCIVKIEALVMVATALAAVAVVLLGMLIALVFHLLAMVRKVFQKMYGNSHRSGAF
mmetsp:Transcript_13372/g.26367  ORF Transcript_13372/g.26367 Transcript_13372/m.26367 type:complete len:429 (-) Transcript_13372:209-1495(-)